MSRALNLAAYAAKRTEIIVVLFLLMAVVMMIIPLPKALVDVLIALSIALSILVLMVAFYIHTPLELSVLPGLILLSTLFRLALSITTTRLILLHADAGRIVEAFGKFVVAGQVVIGLVIFLIITIAQFVVITKGSERVAEVAARFSLDAMPGKQMSIDNDLRNGDIDAAEARQRRAALQRESQLFGAMDGAMKFVKGDAIAGLIILLINLLGGLLIGLLSKGMSFAQAGYTYSLLTVGDGLIAQVPALLISVAAGTVVTRVANDDDLDIGSEILQQLGRNQRALGVTAVILAAAGLVPGFPALVFFSLGTALGGCAFVLARRAGRQPAAMGQAEDSALTATDEAGEPGERERGDERLCLQLGPALAETLPRQRLRQRLEATCLALGNRLGVAFEVPAVQVEMGFAPRAFRLELDSVPVKEGELPTAAVMLKGDPLALELAGIASEEGHSPLTGRPIRWVAETDTAPLDAAGIAYWRLDELLGELVGAGLRRYASEFMGIQETRQWLAALEERSAELVREATQAVPLQVIAGALRRLVAEGVAIRNRRLLLEALAGWNGRESDAGQLADYLRAALARQLSHQYADAHRVIAAVVLDGATEGTLLDVMRPREPGRIEPHGHAIGRALVNQLREYSAGLGEGQAAVLVSHPQLRQSIARLCERDEVPVAVLAFSELAAEYSLQAIKVIELPPATALGDEDLLAEAFGPAPRAGLAAGAS